MNSLPKTVTRQHHDCDLNLGPSAPVSSTLTTRLPSHPYMHTIVTDLGHPAAARRPVGCLLCCCFLVIFTDSCQTNYHKIYRIHLCKIFRVGRTMAVDDQPEISFSMPQETSPN